FFLAAARPALGLVGVHQLRLLAGDQLWTTDLAEVREATEDRGYVDEGVAAYVSPVPAPCTVEVERFQSHGLHRYATTPGLKNALRGAGWTPEGVFYAAKPADATATATSAPTPAPTPSPAPTATVASEPETVIDSHFDDVRVGPVTPNSFNQAVGPTNRDQGAYDSMTYVKQPDGGRSRFVRTHLAAHEILDRNDSPGDGNVLVVPLEDQSRDAACISYDVRFSAGFEVSGGGKLPGLLGVAPGTSPANPTGGGSTEHGWSGRVMWLGPKLSKIARDAGGPDVAVTYLYHPGQQGTFGDDLSWGRGLVDGGWHEVRQCYTLNTIGQSDGVLQAWIDDSEVLDRTDIVYRTDPKVHVTHLAWSVFRGGDNDDWAADTPGDVDIDNLKVTVG
ncbi:MAG: polysaccharide lyase, partial [Janthinobacterium lividum]